MRSTERKGKGRNKDLAEEILYRYNAANQILSSVSSKGTETTYSFDPNGSQTTKTEVTEDETKVTTYAYDFNSKLTDVCLPNGKKVSYTYDGLGNRTSRTLTKPDGKTDTAEYLNDLSNPLVQVLQKAADKETLTYLYGLQRISVTSERPEKNNPKPDTDYYLYDGLGSVKALVDSHGNQVARYSYDEWGVPDPSSNFKGAGHPNTYGFTGEDWDPDTELLYLRARYYSSALGRMLTPDAVFDIKHLVTAYGYAANNPTSMVDPTGLWAEDIHLSITIRVATEPQVGFSYEEAVLLARANASIDQPPYGDQRYRHENTGWPWYPSQVAAAEAELTAAIKTNSLSRLGIGLHSIQDEIGHTFPGTGSYVHWYEPTPDGNPDRYEQTVGATREYLMRYRAGQRR